MTDFQILNENHSAAKFSISIYINGFVFLVENNCIKTWENFRFKIFCLFIKCQQNYNAKINVENRYPFFIWKFSLRQWFYLAFLKIILFSFLEITNSSGGLFFVISVGASQVP